MMLLLLLLCICDLKLQELKESENKIQCNNIPRNTISKVSNFLKLIDAFTQSMRSYIYLCLLYKCLDMWNSFNEMCVCGRGLFILSTFQRIIFYFCFFRFDLFLVFSFVCYIQSITLNLRLMDAVLFMLLHIIHC